MKKREIDRKLDEIVAFAEIEKFIDTPVKHYSSGMYVRLAFAVAAHLEPEILLVDEVLAVGDINFQKKCLGKMGDVARAGRTVVLVSHQMNQMRRLCDRVVWVDGGTIRMIGTAHEVVSAYESAMSRGDRQRETANAHSEAAAQFKGWEIEGNEPDSRHKLESFGPVTIKFELQANKPINHGHHGVALYNHNREIVWGRAVDGLKLAIGRHELRHAFPMLPLRPGLYSWFVSFWEQSDLADMCECVPEMCVVTDSHQHPDDRWNGMLNFPVPFAAERRADE
jgi:lipopolysaccharide transport system ATP-binding protein